MLIVIVLVTNGNVTQLYSFSYVGLHIATTTSKNVVHAFTATGAHAFLTHNSQVLSNAVSE